MFISTGLGLQQICQYTPYRQGGEAYALAGAWGCLAWGMAMGLAGVLAGAREGIALASHRLHTLPPGAGRPRPPCCQPMRKLLRCRAQWRRGSIPTPLAWHICSALLYPGYTHSPGSTQALPRLYPGSTLAAGLALLYHLPGLAWLSYAYAGR